MAYMVEKGVSTHAPKGPKMSHFGVILGSKGGPRGHSPGMLVGCPPSKRW